MKFIIRSWNMNLLETNLISSSALASLLCLLSWWNGFENSALPGTVYCAREPRSRLIWASSQNVAVFLAGRWPSIGNQVSGRARINTVGNARLSVREIPSSIPRCWPQIFVSTSFHSVSLYAAVNTRKTEHSWREGGNIRRTVGLPICQSNENCSELPTEKKNRDFQLNLKV